MPTLKEKEERKRALALADEILHGPKTYCRHDWEDTNLHDTEHWLNGEKSQWCPKCGKDRWKKINIQKP